MAGELALWHTWICSSGSELLLRILVKAKLCVLPKLCSPALGEERGELLNLRPWRCQ